MEKKFLKFGEYIIVITVLSPLGKDGALHLNWHDLQPHKVSLCQIWLKMIHMLWKSKTFKCCNVLLSTLGNRAGSFIWTNINTRHPRMLCAKFGYIGPVVLEKIFLWKRAAHFIWTNTNHINQGCFVPKVEISSVVSEKKMKMWKVYRETDRWTNFAWIREMFAFITNSCITYMCSKQNTNKTRELNDPEILIS